VFVAAPICGNVIIWDIFEVKDGLFSKTMLAFNDDGPKDAAESLFELLVLYMTANGGPGSSPYLDFSPI
jgi:hypothetical protein